MGWDGILENIIVDSHRMHEVARDSWSRFFFLFHIACVDPSTKPNTVTASRVVVSMSLKCQRR